jgi:leucyl/phenylalanyl-tRNA---protein transferase
MLEAYRRGLFPMGDPDTGDIGWYDPDPRGVIPLEPGGFRVTRSLRAKVRQGRFEITSDQAFERVIRACAKPRDEDGVWISEPIVEAYCTLHAHGHAHSVEAWVEGENGESTLVGGLYGVSVGAAFAGESMFSRPDLGGTDASKVCLVHLVGHLRRAGVVLLDTQFTNPHLEQFGCIEIPRDEYRRQLIGAMEREVGWEPFEARGCVEAPVDLDST